MREMQLSVPSDLMSEVADLIEQDDLENSIVGLDDDRILINFSYPEKKRGTIMEILELIEDFDEENEDDDQDEDDEQDDDDDEEDDDEQDDKETKPRSKRRD